ncbi:MAG: ABC transporter permease [Chitinophagales bacterium]
MKYLLHMAFRNLSRNRTRTAVSVLAIGLAVAIVVFAQGIIGGMIDTFLDDTIRFGSGHIRVVQKAYPKKERLLTLSYPVDGPNGEDVSSFAQRLSRLPGVTSATPRIRFAALISRGDQEPEGALGLGLDFPKEEALHLDRYLTKGRLPRAGASEVLMGQRLLDKLGLKVGSHVTLVANTAYGSLAGRTFTVAGSLATGLAQLDESTVMLSLSSAQRLLDLNGAATEIIVMTQSQEKAQQVTPEVAKFVGEGEPSGRYTAIPWYKASTMVGYMILARNYYNILYAVIVLFASFVVINTMLMIVNERTREIGMLGALGFTGRQIVMLLVLEGAALGLLGSIGGVAVGSAITKALATTGLDFSSATKTIGKEILFRAKVYPVFRLGPALYSFVLGIIVPALGCYFPARRAQRLDPSTALRAQ